MTGVYGADYFRYQLERGKLRRFVRRAYLRSACSKVRGPTLDFGCGAGDLLSRLPAGSVGLEYNHAAVEYCRSLGLDVYAYDGFSDEWSLGTLGDTVRFESMVVSHVLEHLPNPMTVLRRLLMSAAKFGVRRVLVIVPGRAGFDSDRTHLTFVDLDMLVATQMLDGTGFEVRASSYFPGNYRLLGDWLSHHELQVEYRLQSGGPNQKCEGW